ncbi:hypothetical protein GCM10007094_44370 [Pseudovibrio japonicus]|uniref:ImpA N-terminal domain-containing protein n=1 Tax=Pseudovibrio japonicus TaxID=366534 RepID=A0ABQ3ETL6_9HYPH|nr:type VI secretion system ImpA family N-terminal domain-containing protein [Pseudovibrio japonicus]GHB50220.1 hypothetical protein GCM10007094_44370 [Pseudovibrio japonicus]
MMITSDNISHYLKSERSTYRELRNLFNTSQSCYRTLCESQETLSDKDLREANSKAWSEFENSAVDILNNVSLDIELFCWYLVSLSQKQDGLIEFQEALRTFSNLLETDIDRLQPIPPQEKLKSQDEREQKEEIATLKLRPIRQLFGEAEGKGLLYLPISNLPLLGEISYWKLIQVEKNGTLEDLKDDISAVVKADPENLRKKLATFQNIISVVVRIENTVKNYAQDNGQPAPQVIHFKRFLDDVVRCISVHFTDLGFALPDTPHETAEELPARSGEMAKSDTYAGQTPEDEVSRQPSGIVSSREQALEEIAALATYFRRREPHSPISLLLDRAVRWGNLSAGQLYQEILTEGSVGMAQMALLTGLESQGYSDQYKRSSSRGLGDIEHPKLPDYHAALPKPHLTENPQITEPAEEKTANPTRSDMSANNSQADIEPDQVGINSSNAEDTPAEDADFVQFKW